MQQQVLEVETGSLLVAAGSVPTVGVALLMALSTRVWRGARNFDEAWRWGK